MSAASFSTSSMEARRLARMGGTEEMGETRKFMSCRKATATPALTAWPPPAKSAAAMNTPNCARKPAPPASI